MVVYNLLEFVLIILINKCDFILFSNFLISNIYLAKKNNLLLTIPKSII